MTPDVTVSIMLAIKIFVLIGLLLYAGFSFIIVRQEQLMADVLEEGFEPVLRLITLGHFVASVGVIVLALLVL